MLENQTKSYANSIESNPYRIADDLDVISIEFDIAALMPHCEGTDPKTRSN
jgi:hypothetical protein